MADKEPKAGYRPPSRIGTKATTFYLREDLLQRLKLYSVLTRTPMWQLVTTAVEQFLAKERAPDVPGMPSADGAPGGGGTAREA